MQRFLDAGAFGVKAGRDQAESCGSAVEVGGGVDVGAGLEEKVGDLRQCSSEFSGDILRRRWRRCSAEEWLDGGGWNGRESSPDFRASRFFECRDVAGDDGVGGKFESD